eukprot:TRINITY_DN416_c0_g1_i8.p2 TRINITY_DN416_c0_g1~~TRINITY_DN416_c0_g1_i8.p2  ORF type:complete len:144 (+),score=40.61 TRINITY_DN416_c0_g1_i8:268-699(+)
MDVSAYMARDLWLHVLACNGWTEADLLNRYDCVVHLVTAADGAEKFFTRANNAARRETPAEAIELDRKVQAAWSSHSDVVVVTNHVSSFEEKVDKVREALASKVARLPSPTPAGAPAAAAADAGEATAAGATAAAAGAELAPR